MNTAVKPAILLVDDEQSICSALRRTFKQNHYHVYEANSGNQALDVLQNNAIDVVVSDQRMPGMTGTELLSIVKSKYPQTGRIILSGHSDIHDLTAAINKANIHRFIPKPWNNLELLDTVNRAIPKHYSPESALIPLQPCHTTKKKQSSIVAIDDAFAAKQIDLEKSIKNDVLELTEHSYQKEDARLRYLNIMWPIFSRFEHAGIINIAKQSGYTNDLFTWYLLKVIEYIDNQTDGAPPVIDLFMESFDRQPSLKKLIQSIIQKKPDIIFRISFDALKKDSLTDLLVEIYRGNSTLLLNLGKRVIDINDLKSTPIRYIEMDGKQISLNNHLLTEKRLKMLRDTENNSIKTILTGVKQKHQHDYAKTMGFDYY
ncbi:MAG: response regulator [Cellvibrionaceae bacterium]